MGPPLQKTNYLYDRSLLLGATVTHCFPGAADFPGPELCQVPHRFPAHPQGQGYNGGKGTGLWGAFGAAAPNQYLQLPAPKSRQQVRPDPKGHSRIGKVAGTGVR